MYAVMYRTPGGNNVLMKETYRSLDDGEAGVLDSFPWVSEIGWVRGENSSTFNLSDGSSFTIYQE
jgi:hypothetical protein